MKKKMMIYVFVSLFGVKGLANLPSLAVSKPHVEELQISQDVLSRLIQLEYIKTEKYRVYDEFDLQEALEKDSSLSSSCNGKNCLLQLGKKLDVDYVLSGSFTQISDKIIISLKLIDIKKGIVVKNKVQEFIHDTDEIHRMIRVMVAQMEEREIATEIISQLKYDEGPVVKSPVGKINNSGTRLGYSMFTGDLREFALRPKDQGGLDIFPGVSMIGYQFEKQYIGTENFSALVEGVAMVSGLEQGIFIPTFTFMNGLRFGKGGWEFAFGPGFGLKRVSRGFYDTQGIYGDPGRFWTQGEFWDLDLGVESAYETSEFLDARSNTFKLDPRWVMAFGRTFKAGGLNVPVNVFISSTRGSTTVGASVGFNVWRQ